MSTPKPPNPPGNPPAAKKPAATQQNPKAAAKPKPAMTAAERSARAVKFAAWVAAGAALLSAAAAAGGTYWSADRAAKSASETVTLQLSGETDRSRAEFLRGKRQMLYVWVITDERELNSLEVDSYNKIKGYTRLEGKKAAKVSEARFLDPFNLKQENMDKNLSSIVVIGSKEVREAYPKLSESRQKMHSDLYKLLKCTAHKSCDIKAERESYSALYDGVKGQRDEFIGLVQRDMGIQG
jgi:hypothetical protein